jgi:YebC/PmpR family DNA-binding regulatory protein
MAGHSKWAKLKHTKGKSDTQKAQMFSKLSRVISIEAKASKGDRNSPGLRTAIEKARAANMPADTINRAVEKASAAGEMEKVVYETYGPGGVAIIIEGWTDKRSRTAPEIKHILVKHGYELAAPGAAMWAFVKSDEGLTPTMTTDLSDEDLEKLSALVDELEDHNDINDVYTNAA